MIDPALLSAVCSRTRKAAIVCRWTRLAVTNGYVSFLPISQWFRWTATRCLFNFDERQRSTLCPQKREGKRSMSRLTKFKIERTSSWHNCFAPSEFSPAHRLACCSPDACLSVAFRHPLKLDPEYPEKTWHLLENAIQEINADRSSGLSFEELHRNAYNMVVRHCSAPLCFTFDSALLALVCPSHLTFWIISGE